jgi:hypothetical protein
LLFLCSGRELSWQGGFWRKGAQQASKDARTRWKQRVDEQLKAGAGALHRFTKRQDLVIDEAAAVHDGLDPPSLHRSRPTALVGIPQNTAPAGDPHSLPALAVGLPPKWGRERGCPQSTPHLSGSLHDTLGCDKDAWEQIWRTHAGSAKAPWREGFDPNAAFVATLPKITVEDLRAAAKTFKRRTSLGGDSTHPRACGWLSDEVLQGWADLMMNLELVGIRPAQVSIKLMAQISKAGGGKRPVGLLSGFV